MRSASDVTCCRIPQPMPADEAAGYQGLREAHCENGRAGHDCSGRLIIDRNGVTLACPLCGDARTTYPKEIATDGR